MQRHVFVCVVSIVFLNCFWLDAQNYGKMYCKHRRISTAFVWTLDNRFLRYDWVENVFSVSFWALETLFILFTSILIKWSKVLPNLGLQFPSKQRKMKSYSLSAASTGYLILFYSFTPDCKTANKASKQRKSSDCIHIHSHFSTAIEYYTHTVVECACAHNKK